MVFPRHQLHAVQQCGRFSMQILNTTAIFCALLVLVASREDLYEATRNKCQAQLGLTDDELKHGKKNLEPMKCYIYCFLKDIGAMDEAGNFDSQQAIAAIGADIREASRPVVNKCNDEYKDVKEACEHGYDIIKCFALTNPEVYDILGLFQKPPL